jgi:dTDP-4-dehydrorhamnose reductase
MASIFAVILTFNRRELVARCLECIFVQSHACDRVIVIDNCSSDGTSEMIRQEWGDRVEVHTLSRNIGASGGFNVGIRVAYQSGADFVWVMDDDVLPEKDALARLVEADQFLADRGVARAFVISSAWTEDGNVTNVPKIDTRPRAGGYENWPLYLERKMVPVTRATFVSILLPRSIVAQYGLPLAPMFIWGEDSEYTLRITEKCPGYLVSESRVLHLRELSGVVSIMTEVNRTRLKYHRHLIRNQMYTARIHGAKLDFLRHMVRQLQLLLKLAKAHKIEKAGIVLTGFLESFWFHPPVEPAHAPSEQLGVTIKCDHPVAHAASRDITSLGPSAGSLTLAFQKGAAELSVSNGHEASLSEMTVTGSGH